jgi:hypothetical protein
VDECKPLPGGERRGPVHAADQAARPRRRARAAAHLGRAVHVDPINPTLKAPEANLLTFRYEKQLSSVAFKINLRRYTSGLLNKWSAAGKKWVVFFQDTNSLVFRVVPGALGRGAHSSTVQLNLSSF